MNPTTTATRLPHLASQPFLSDGGLETTLVFHHGMELPYFAAFDLLKSGEGRAILHDYYHRYASMAHQYGTGFLLESPTWRANPEWARRMGYSLKALDQANRDAIGLMHEIREGMETPASPMVISGCVGPRGDGYQPSARMSVQEAKDYHGPQLQCYRDAGADFGSAITMNYLEEALGIAEAAAALEFPVVISFTLETDGRLPTGHSLSEVIEILDAQASQAPAYYMINCAHPTHFQQALKAGVPWMKRIGGLRTNASMRSHAELDASPDLDAGNPEELGRQHRDMLDLLPCLKVFGGCCGTDERHIAAIAQSCITASVTR